MDKQIPFHPILMHFAARHAGYSYGQFASDYRTLDRIRGAEALRKQLGPGVPVIGWIEGPLAESCDLAGVNEILLKIHMEPDFIRRLMDKIMPVAKAFAMAQVEAGCDIIGVGDAICSQIDVDSYRDLVKEKQQELFEYIQALGAKVKLHICGNLDPVAVIQDQDPESILRETDMLCQQEEGRPFILSGGCEITVNTPPEHLKTMRSASLKPGNNQANN